MPIRYDSPDTLGLDRLLAAYAAHCICKSACVIVDAGTAVTVDAVIFRQMNGGPEVLLIQRGQPPFAGQHALPGGFLELDEELIDGARRELQEETSLVCHELEEIGTFGNIGRDPRGRVISVVFAGVVDAAHSQVKGGDDAAEALFVPLNQVGELAFDHNLVLARAASWLNKRSGE